MKSYCARSVRSAAAVLAVCALVLLGGCTPEERERSSALLDGSGVETPASPPDLPDPTDVIEPPIDDGVLVLAISSAMGSTPPPPPTLSR